VTSVTCIGAPADVARQAVRDGVSIGPANPWPYGGAASKRQGLTRGG